MAINFPNNPNPNDTWTSGGKTWLWDGTSWKLISTSGSNLALNDLTDVNTTGAVNTKILKYNGTNWIVADDETGSGGGGGSSTLSGLTDVTISSATNGQALMYNGSAWINDDLPTNTTYALSADSNNSPNQSITLTDSNNVKTGVDLAVGSGSGFTITRSSNVLTFGGSPTTIAVTDESVDVECYPLFTTEATGNLAPKTVTSFKLNSSTGQLEAGSFKKTGGTAAEFLKADGSVDSNTYSQSNHTHSYGLNDLSDVTTGTISDGDVLKYSGTNSRWEAQTDATGGATTLGALTDVDTTGAVNNKILKYNGTNWVVADDATGGSGGSSNFTGLADTPSSLQADKWLKVNSGSTALEFVNAPALNSLTDVTISGSPADDSILQYDTTDSKWKPASLPTSGNTTYSFSSVEGGTGVQIRLTGSDSTEDNVLLTPGTGLELDSITADGFTIKSTDTLDSVTGRNATTNNAVTVGNLTCNNLTVNGTTTTVNSNTVNIGDSNLTLNSDETGAPSQDGGITIERGTSDNVEIRWNETSDKWQYTNDGTNFLDLGGVNTTYALSADSDNSPNESITLTDSNGTKTGIDLKEGDNIQLSRTGSVIEIKSAVYDMTTDAVTGGGIIRLTNEMDTTTDDIQILGGTSITVQRSADHKITINGDITDLNSLSDVVISGSVGDDSILQYDTGDQKWKPVDGDSVGTTIPAGTIVMYNGDTAPTGWALCDGGGGRPDLRDKFVVGAGSSYNRGSSAGSADAVVVSHNHGSGNTGNQSANHNHNAGNQNANHTHGPGNSMATNFTGDHYHQLWSGNSNTLTGSGTTGNQSINHYHTVSPTRPNSNLAGVTTVTTSGGSHGHSYRVSNGHSQSNMSGISRSGGDNPNSTNNSDILSSGGNHSHTVDCEGLTTGGVDVNHTHNFNFSVSGNTTNSSTGNHAHNINGNTGNESSNHNHNLGNQSANHTHSISSEGVSGTGKNLPPYYAITFIIKT